MTIFGPLWSTTDRIAAIGVVILTLAGCSAGASKSDYVGGTDGPMSDTIAVESVTVAGQVVHPAGYADHAQADSVRLRPETMVECHLVPSLRPGAEDDRMNRNQNFTVILSPTFNEETEYEHRRTTGMWWSADSNEPGEPIVMTLSVPSQPGVYLVSIFHLSSLLPGGQTIEAFQGFVTVDPDAEHSDYELDIPYSPV